MAVLVIAFTFADSMSPVSSPRDCKMQIRVMMNYMMNIRDNAVINDGRIVCVIRKLEEWKIN